MENVAFESPRQHATKRTVVKSSAANVGVASDRAGKRRGWLRPTLLMLALLLCAGALVLWKKRAFQAANMAAASQPEPMEAVSTAVAQAREHRRTTTSIGTVVATRSITLRNEIPGTVRQVMLEPGQIVEAGTVLVALDTSVEEAELKAQEAHAAMAETLLARTERAVQHRATSEMDLDRARAERDVAQAQIARAKAVIERKTIRAPFRARIGLSDLHEGQYLEAGTFLTSLQGVDPGVFVDFTVPQQIGQMVGEGQQVDVLTIRDSSAIAAKIVALDSRTDPNTRNTTVRARIDDAQTLPPPGASVRVRVPVGEPMTAAAVPVSALRKGPGGDHVFVIAPDAQGKTRAHVRVVQSGPVLGDEVLILSGLKPGEQIAASGSFKLREGVLVAIAPGTPVSIAATNSAAAQQNPN